MKRLAIAVCLLLAGCGEPMQNEKIIATVKLCNDAGLFAAQTRDWRYRITGIQCTQRGL